MQIAAIINLLKYVQIVLNRPAKSGRAHSTQNAKRQITSAGICSHISYAAALWQIAILQKTLRGLRGDALI